MPKIRLIPNRMSGSYVVPGRLGNGTHGMAWHDMTWNETISYGLTEIKLE